MKWSTENGKVSTLGDDIKNSIDFVGFSRSLQKIEDAANVQLVLTYAQCFIINSQAQPDELGIENGWETVVPIAFGNQDSLNPVELKLAKRANDAQVIGTVFYGIHYFSLG